MTLNRLRPATTAPVYSLYSFQNFIALFFILNTMPAFGVIDNLVYGHWLGKGSDKITQVFQILMILSSVYLFSRSYRMIGIRTGSTLALLTITYLFMTSLWSTEPSATIKEAFVYLIVLLGVIGLVGRYRPNEYLGILFIACFISGVASLLLLIVSPGNAMMEDGGGMQGIFPHKNILGQVMATGVLAALYHKTKGSFQRTLKVIGILIFVGLAACSKSATALVTIFVFCGTYAFTIGYRAGGGSRTISTALAVVAVPILIMVVVYPDAILELIGKDPTLTGRTEIWGYVMDDIALKPLFGWGYFGFWLPTNPYALEIANIVHWFVPQSHNGLLELLLTTGLIGTTLFTILFVRNIALAVKCLRTTDSNLAVFTLVYAVGILMTGISENVLLAPTEPSTTVFFITGLMCERALVFARTRQRRPVARSVPRTRPVSAAPADRYSRFR
ncbi:MAG TPA: O-antigen ligase family protein [Aliidongia sp.]|nr:O-antigen ligase family protein [Aliidongia sp.]